MQHAPAHGAAGGAAATAAPAQVFISYRRDDSAGYARALHDTLARRLGEGQVFIDVEDIGAGQAFDRSLADALRGARVLLVLIGPRWLAPQPGGKPPRLHDAADFVHQEVATALGAGLQVLPLLLDGAAMPAEAELPAPLRALARRQALAIDARRFAADSERLLAALQPMLGPAAPAAPAPIGPPVAATTPAAAGLARRRWGVRLAAAAALAGVAAAALWAWQQPPPRAAVNGRWLAEVVYDWPGARYTETLLLAGEGSVLTGSASFLRVPRGIEGGQLDGDHLRFTTRSTEQQGDVQRSVSHQWQGRLVGDTLQLTMLTVGAAQPHQPVAVQARRAPP